jgi:hypothetical protein
VGGTIGALVVGGFKAEPGYSSSQSVFWKSFLLTVILTAIVVFSMSKGPPSETIFMLGALIAMAGPLFLLGASLLMLVWLVFRSDLPAAAGYWRQWGKITLGVIIGSVVGFLAMYLPYVISSHR